MVIPCNDRWSLQRSTLSCKRKVCERKVKEDILCWKKISIWALCLDSQVSHHDFRPSAKCAAFAKLQHAEREILCLDMFWIHFIFNDRLTLILHISGLSTQWQVHMVCFSEMHPDPTSQPHAFIHPHPPPPLLIRICLLIWSSARTLGNQQRCL